MEIFIYIFGSLSAILFSLFTFFYKHRKKTSILALIFSILLLFTTAFFIFKRDEPKLIVSPKKISIDKNYQYIMEKIKVYNNHDSFLYQIWIKISSSNELFSQECIKLKPENKNNDSIKFGKYNFNTFFVRFIAREKNGEISSFILVDNIGPKEILTFDLSGYLGSSLNTELSVKLLSFKNYPNSKGFSKNFGASLSFRPPMNLELLSICPIITINQ